MSKMNIFKLLAAFSVLFLTYDVVADGTEKLVFQNLVVGPYTPLNVRYKQSLKWSEKDEPKIPVISLDAGAGNIFFPNLSSDDLAKFSDKAWNPFFTINSTLFGTSNIEVSYKPSQSVKTQYTYYLIEWAPPWATLFIPYAIGLSFSVGGIYSKNTYERTAAKLTIESKAMDGTARIHLGSIPVIFVVDMFLGVNVTYGTSNLNSSNLQANSINQTYSTGIIGFQGQIANLFLFSWNLGLNFNELVPILNVSLAAEF